jgi:hypothetical protein
VRRYTWGEPISDADFKPLKMWVQLGRIPRKAYVFMFMFQLCTVGLYKLNAVDS